MKKLLLASLLGASAMIIWQILTWTIIPLHQYIYSAFPENSTIVNSYQKELHKKGTYHFPISKTDKAITDQPSFITSFYYPQGNDLSLIFKIIIGFVIDFVTLLFITFAMQGVIDMLDHFLKRLLLVSLFGLSATTAIYFYMWNWMHFPMHFIALMIVEFLIGWLAAAVIVSFMLKPVHRYIVP